VAKSQGGAFILRVEDTDIDREREGSEAQILDDIRWLGLAWDEGPYRQSERGVFYAEAARQLVAANAAFPCFCATPGDEASRDAAHGRAPGHRDPCRDLRAEESARRVASGEAHAVRFRVPGAGAVSFDDRLHGPVSVPSSQIGDAVIVRREGRPTYNFAVVVDDVAMRIDLVLRGDDHLSNTPLQVLLYRALHAPIPSFAHVPMVLGPDGERLSKRHGATSVGAWRERGVPPEALVNGLALLGWAPSGDRTIVSMDEIVGEFDLDRVGRSAAIFDPVKLDWISSQHIHAMEPRRLAVDVERALVAAGRIDEEEAATGRSWIGEVAEFLRPSLSRFDQVAAQVEPIFHAGGPLSPEDRAVLEQPQARDVVARLAEVIEAGTLDWNAVRATIAGATGQKGKALFQPLRVALTGREHGRELDRLWHLIVAGAAVLPGRVPSLASRVRAALEATA
jgi:glutamyl-tRNA synthetase